MELQDIIVFERVARKGSFTKAARSLNLAQPSVTTRVRSLEGQLGRELFLRSRRGVELTPAGKTFLAFAERILTLVQEGQQAVRAESAQHDRVLVASIPSVSSYLLPKVVERLTMMRPFTEVRIISGRSEQVLELLGDGVAHIGFLAATTPAPSFDLVPIYDDPITCVAPAQHPLLRHRQPCLADVVAYPLALFNWGPGYAEFKEQLRAAARCPMCNIIEVDPVETARTFVADEGRVSFLPHSAVVRDARAGRLCTVPVDLPCPPVPIAVAFTRRRRRSEAEDAFLQLLIDVCPVFRMPELGEKEANRRHPLQAIMKGDPNAIRIP